MNDRCPVCRVEGMQPCVNPADERIEVADHTGRPLALVTAPAIQSTATELEQLQMRWRAAQLTQQQAITPTAQDKAEREEQRTYDALIDYIEANGLNYTAHDPRGQEES
jgi:hypothetical protein